MDWRTVRDRITKETRDIWLREPEDVKKLVEGVIDCRAGTYGQYFSTLVFADGEIRALGIYCAFGLVKAAQLEHFTLENLKAMARFLLDVAPGFLAYCGLKQVGRFTVEILEALDTVKTKEEFSDLIMAYMCYCNRVHMWMLLLFPWGVGSEFTYTTPEETYAKTYAEVKEIYRKVSGLSK